MRCLRVLGLPVGIVCGVGVVLGLPGVAVAGGCANEAVRAQTESLALPDCRAYEMVSPPYKEGYPMFPLSYAADGDQTILYSLGDLAGSEGSGENAERANLYLAKRSPMAGWTISQMNASASEFVGQIPKATEASDEESLWEQHTPAQSVENRGLYVRSATGLFGFVGPLGLPVIGKEEPSNILDPQENRVSYAVAATSDYGHVVLRARSPEDYWPFDMTTGSSSLYEYSGMDNSQPILVGVNGDKGSEQLISQCGTLIGSGSLGSAYNALSADGETVFFTVEPGCGGPAFAEVYARKHGSLSSPAPAETFDVSARQCTNTECMEESGKNFEGASENGERVFFTSTQKLTNNAVNRTASGDAAEKGCSKKGTDGCNLYEYEFMPEGGRLSLVSGGEVLGVAGIAEDGTRVYYVSSAVTPGVGANEYGASPQVGGNNLYVYDTSSGATAFIATLNAAGEGEKVWQKSFAHPVEVTGEGGRFLLFATATPGLTGSEDTSSLVQLFEYDAVTGELVRVTKGEEGYNENGNGVTTGVEPEVIASKARHIGNGEDFKSASNRLNIAVDGRTVFFETAGRLSARAVSAEVGCTSVYEFRTGGTLAEGSLHLISDGRDTQPNKGSTCGAEFVAMDDDGANVLFTTADPLVGSDTDGFERDVYDAREGGGFPVAPGGELGSCGAGSCEGVVSSAPVLPVAGSAVEAGEGAISHIAKPSVKKKVKKKKKAKVKKKAKSKVRVMGKGLGAGMVVGFSVGRGL